MTSIPTSETQRRLTGRCLCTSVEYSVADAFDYAMNCHCSRCRRATGAAFKPFAGHPARTPGNHAWR